MATSEKQLWWKSPLARKVGVGLAVVAVIALLGWWFFLHPYVGTDDARVAMTLVRVAPSGVSGRIEKVNVTEGSRVKAGDIMVELDHRVPQAQYDKAKARAALTEREKERLEKLFAQRSTTQQSVDIARANWAQADSELKLAEVALENTSLRAPFDGIVVQKLAEVGNLLESGQTAVVVADEAHAWVAANIEETSVADVKIGQVVSISIDEGGSLRGHVSEVRHAVASQFALIPADNGAGNYTKVVQRVPIKVALDDPGSRVLRAGQSVEIKIRVH
jgi:membrane fusion protein (multidrug efflux system)